MPSGGSRKHPLVLVVEDEALVRLSLLDTIEDAGFEAVSASDAHEALEILQAHNDIGVVLTDVQMPGAMDGLKLAEVVCERWPVIDVVVTSGRPYLAQELPPHCHFLNKPCRPADVIELLNQLVPAHRSMSSN